MLRIALRKEANILMKKGQLFIVVYAGIICGYHLDLSQIYF